LIGRVNIVFLMGFACVVNAHPRRGPIAGFHDERRLTRNLVVT